MISREIVVKNNSGWHALYCARIRQFIQQFDCDIYIRYHCRVVNTKSMASLLRCCISCGDRVTVLVDGPDEAEVLDQFVDFLDTLTI